MPPEANTTHADDDEVIPELALLDQPRPLTPIERALVDFLLEPPYGDDQLRAQAPTAIVIGVCSCGCASAFLGVDSAAPMSVAAEWTPGGPHDLTAYQVKSRGLGAEMTLHVSEGRPVELEIWAGTYGTRPRVDPAKLKRVQEIDGRAGD
jgi:hypothetical protein